MTTWTDAQIPDQTGRVAFVTGATSGLGLRCATALAEHGARVLMSYHDGAKGRSAVEAVARVARDAPPEGIPLDLTDPRSVADAAAEVRERAGDTLDILINNAGIMAPPRTIVPSGHESQWATNVLGPAALTWQLLPAMTSVPRSRIVTITSVAMYIGDFDPHSIAPELRGANYRRVAVYCHTKLADLAFARELQRRLAASGAKTMSVAAHPGMAESRIAANIAQNSTPVARRLAIGMYNLPAQPTTSAAWPLLFAATFPRMRGGYLAAPRGPFQVRGKPTAVPGSRLSRDPEFAAEVWRLLERETGVSSPL